MTVWSSTFLALAMVFIAAGCGSKTSASNQSPSVSILAPDTVDADATIKLTANAEDKDGSIVSLQWSIISGSAVSIQGETGQRELNLRTQNLPADAPVRLSVIAIDNQGASAQAFHTLTVRRGTYAITLKGKVDAGVVLAGAQVSIVIGEQIFTTNTNATGDFSRLISVDKAHAGLPVTITAQGVGPQTLFKLVSQLNSIAYLQTQAGSGDVLTPLQNKALNVNYVSTAEYALLIEHSSYEVDKLITSDPQLKQLLALLSPQMKLTYASWLYLLATDESFKLPSGTANTLDLLQDERARNRFVSA